jgi:cysteine desulfuration protein SufE
MDELFEEKVGACPPPLQTIIEEFQEATPRERLDYLLEYGNDLPDLPARLHDARDAMEQVHECQSPVFLHTELEAAEGDAARVHFFIDIPREAPTVRGYASALLSGLQGATPAQVLATPEDVYMLMGLHEAITPQRLRGLHALMVYMKRQVRKLA